MAESPHSVVLKVTESQVPASMYPLTRVTTSSSVPSVVPEPGNAMSSLVFSKLGVDNGMVQVQECGDFKCVVNDHPPKLDWS